MKRRAWLVCAFAIAGFSLPASGQVEAPPPVTAEQARAAFERFKALDGVWKGQSTKGWTDHVVYRALAAGSAIIQTSFEAHPNEMMATLVHPDGDRLLLTHYCVARNQPRLVLSGFERDGARLTFTFIDGTNMASRDVGHMDKVVYDFGDPGGFTSRWTWYQKGKESWMEEIRYTRVDSTTAVPLLQAPAHD